MDTRRVPIATGALAILGAAAVHAFGTLAGSAPADPAYHEARGIALARNTPDDAQLRQASEELLVAARLRPTSPYTWAALAQVKYRAGNLDDRFEKALRNAVLFGPQEPEVQRLVADLGLAAWPQLGASSRRAVESAIDAGLNRQAAAILQIAERRGRLEIACRRAASLRSSGALEPCGSGETRS